MKSLIPKSKVLVLSTIVSPNTIITELQVLASVCVYLFYINTVTPDDVAITFSFY